KVGKQTLFTVLTAMPVYAPFRDYIWRYALRIVRISWRVSTTPHPVAWPVWPRFLLLTIWLTGLVLTMWEVSHAAFKFYFSMEPKKDSRLLSEFSMDPNGTLITGLQSNKPFTQAIAFWELAYIAWRCPERRKNLFID